MCFEKAADNLLNFILEYQDMIPNDYENLNQHEIKAAGGKVISTGIVNNKFMSIARTHFTSQGMTMNWHAHKEGETIILQRGAPLYIEIKGVKDCIKVTTGRACYVPPNTPHRLAGTEGESWAIVVLIPGSDTFPAGVENGN